MTIRYSGYDTIDNDPLFSEEIEVSGPTPEGLVFRVVPFGNFNGTIFYSWAGIYPCPADLAGDRSCSCENPDHVYTEAHGCSNTFSDFSKKVAWNLSKL